MCKLKETIDSSIQFFFIGNEIDLVGRISIFNDELTFPIKVKDLIIYKEYNEVNELSLAPKVKAMPTTNTV